MFSVRVQFFLNADTKKELTERANYLGVSVSSLILHHLVVYPANTFSRNDFEDFDKDKAQPFQMDISEYVLQKFDGQARYNYALYFYLSVHLQKVVAETMSEWKKWKSKTKQSNYFSTYSVEESVIKRMSEVKKKTKLSFTTMVNYAALLEEYNLRLIDEDGNKKRQGFQLSEEISKYVVKESEEININRGKFLEIKLERLLNRLANNW